MPELRSVTERDRAMSKCRSVMEVTECDRAMTECDGTMMDVASTYVLCPRFEEPCVR